MKIRILTCRSCGCTDEQACRNFGGPCIWISRRPAMCSSCYMFLENIRDAEKCARVLVALGIADDVAEINPFPPRRINPRRPARRSAR